MKENKNYSVIDLGKIQKKRKITNKVQERMLKPTSQETPSEKFEDELKRSLEGSLVLNEKNVETHVSESKGDTKNSLSDVGVTEHVSEVVVSEETKSTEVLHCSPRVDIGFSKKKLLILDVNGLLADIVSPAPKEPKADTKIARRAVFKRPFYQDFLEFCFDRFEVGVWSSRSKKMVDRVVDYLMGDLKQKLLFCWDMSYCTETRSKTLENTHKFIVFKELRKIWERHNGYYNISNTLLLDDSPYKALLNPPHNGVFPYSFKFQNEKDNSLGPGGDLRLYLEKLAMAQNMIEYIKKHPFGQGAITQTSPSWNFYNTVLCSFSSIQSSM